MQYPQDEYFDAIRKYYDDVKKYEAYLAKQKALEMDCGAGI
jgi:hypothetical protein